MRLALGVAYDGSGFDGWQTQPTGRTVQDHLERALAAVADAPVATVAAGRTDAGVHATGQVVHFDTEATRPLSAWVRGVNAHLPAAVAVQWAAAVPDDFHARFSATGRAYRYVLLNAPVRPALFAQQIGWHHQPLDVEAMRAAATHLVGRHDFSSFRSADCQARTPVRTLRSLDIVASGPTIVFSLAADAFLHHMVRNLVGALVYVGKGAHPPEWMGALLAERDRRRAPPTFGAAGLYLAGVEYDPRFGLPEATAPLLPLPHLPLLHHPTTD